MTLDPDFISFIKWSLGGIGTILGAVVAVAGKGLSAILTMLEKTTTACNNQANSNEKVAHALEQLPCVMLRSAHEREPIDGLLREVRSSPSAGGRP